VGYQLVQPASPGNGGQELVATLTVSYLGEDLSAQASSRERWAAWTALTWTPPFSPDIALLVNHYMGPDYYNSFYRDYRQFLRLGICVNRGRTGTGRVAEAPY
jgi:hypothetical protein